MILYTNNERGNGNNHQLHVFNLKTGKEEVQYKEIDLIKSKYLFSIFIPPKIRKLSGSIMPFFSDFVYKKGSAVGRAHKIIFNLPFLKEYLPA